MCTRQHAHVRTAPANDRRANEDRFQIAAVVRAPMRASTGCRAAGRRRCARRRCPSGRAIPAPDCETSLASRIAPAQVPKIGFVSPKRRNGSFSDSMSSSLSMVVLSPPGSPARPPQSRSAAVRTSRVVGARSSSACRCASKSPCSASTPTASHGYQPRVCISSPSGSFEISSPGIAMPRSSLASSSFAGSL